MNKHLYRIVFNAQRGMRMAIAEIASAQRNANSRDVNSPNKVSLRTCETRSTALGFLTATSLFVVSWLLFALPLQAQIIVDRNALKTQQPTLLTTASGVLQVNIQTPSTAGVSRNTTANLIYAPKVPF